MSIHLNQNASFFALTLKLTVHKRRTTLASQCKQSAFSYYILAIDLDGE